SACRARRSTRSRPTSTIPACRWLCGWPSCSASPCPSCSSIAGNRRKNDGKRERRGGRTQRGREGGLHPRGERGGGGGRRCGGRGADRWWRVSSGRRVERLGDRRRLVARIVRGHRGGLPGQ